MTMVMTRRIAAGEFKAKCLRLLDEVKEHGTEVVVTKRGVPIARVVPMGPQADIFGRMKGKIEILGDIIEPIDVEWEAQK